jgi:antitoxin component YwqK of YwqJK toxin-antitoxin module
MLGGKPHGKGAEVNRKGEVIYEGEFKEGKREGEGVLYYKQKKLYEIDFKNGEGTEFNSEGRIKFRGSFKNG